jgi:TonB family protein
LARSSGSLASLALHGSIALLAIWSVTGPRVGRGGGVVGTSEAGSGPASYSAIVQRDPALDFEVRQPDARAFPVAPSEDEADVPEAVPVPPQDFLKEQAETGVPVPRAVPMPDDSARARSKEAYAKLPPSAGGLENEPPTATPGSEQKGSSNVNGSGGETGGAGDGTVGALFMPAPDYPASARRKGIEGVVVVLVDVQSDGHCENARLAESSRSVALDEAALSAIRRWKYEERPGGEIELRRVRFVFKLTR